MKSHSSPEPLESRVAPAAVFTFSDVDGDFVTVKTSRGTDAQLAAIINTAVTGLGLELQEIDFSADSTNFAGTTLTVTAVRTSAGGDGLVNVGYIDAAAVDDGAALDLGAIKVEGDLGRIVAGDATLSTLAVKSLSVGSMQQFGNSTQGGGASFLSEFAGGVGSLTVKGNIAGASLTAIGDVFGRFGAVKIGGSLIGSANNDTGSLVAEGDIGPVKIGGNIEGAGGSRSGAIVAGGELTSVKVGGSVLGGDNSQSGSIRSISAMGAIKIGRDLVGGGGLNSGSITCLANVASIKIGGSFIGGTTTQGGNIFNNGVLGLLKIDGDLRGGTGNQTAYVNPFELKQLIIGGSIVGGSGSVSGWVLVEGTLHSAKIGGDVRGGDAGIGQDIDDTGGLRAVRMGNVNIGGSLIAGTASGGGVLTNSGAIRVEDDLGAVNIKGSIIGNNSHPVLITARGQSAPGATDMAIKSITVGGRVEDALILAGFSHLDAISAENADAQIGAVKVGGDWIASSLVAGAQDDGDDELDPLAANFGDADDVRVQGGNGSVISRIASITIGGAALGTSGGTDHYGFVAQEIGSLRIAGTKFPLIAGPGSAADVAGYAVGVTGDLRIRELPL